MNASSSGSSDSRIPRRQFLELSRGAAVLLAAGAFPAARESQAQDQAANSGKPARVSFGFSLYGMRSLPVADALRTCAEIGYDCVELVTIDGWPCDPPKLTAEARREIRMQLGERKLTLPALMENLNSLAEGDSHRKNLDRLKASAELGHELSPDAPPVIETILGGSPAKWDEVKGRMADALRGWAKVGEATRTIIAVKPHVAGALHTPEGAAWLVEQVGNPWIRLTYDFSHYRLRNLELGRTLEQLLPSTSFIHVKDAKGAADSFQFVLPGDGDIDYGDYLARLKAARYDGAVVVEVSGQLHTRPGYDPIAAARRSYENLVPHFAKAKLRTVGT